MNRLELIAEQARKQELSKAESAQMVETFFEAMAEEICNAGPGAIKI